jgi:SRSO17 transposase
MVERGELPHIRVGNVVRFALPNIAAAQGRLEVWFLYEWPADEPAPTKFWLSNLPANTPLKELVRLAKLRWRVERDYQELKEEIGLDHFEGRSWRGFHHHVTLCAAAHAFLALNRALFPPASQALDPADGATPPPARASKANRLVPALPTTSRRHNPAARPVQDVIE